MVWLKTLFADTCCWKEALYTGFCQECAAEMNIETLADLRGGET
ncbi:hypothetical protein SAMN05443551_0205 [Marivita hallyeonensis]|uniref:Uncharacterized protein n=1 Tax=Marivita hallyeonensis TaxID=996342 RepID=A0A1M5LLJ5_9RHOB|nr:hypothetical protein SAMN05443551_0205 [Marivita hallyeonensis]